MTLIPFDKAVFIVGAAGVPGTGITSGQVADFESRITTLEGNTPPTTLDDLDDFTASGAFIEGQLLRVNASGQVENYTDPGDTFTFGVPFVIDGGGSVITTGVKYTGIRIPFACTVKRWTVSSTVSGNFSCVIAKAPYANPPVYTDISGTDKPTLAAQTANYSTALTGWTTALSAGDMLRLTVDGTPATVTLLTVNLDIERTI